jgi:hypothetical protein
MLRALVAIGVTAGAVGLLWIIGRWQIVRALRENEKVLNLVIEYHNMFVRYLDSEGRGHEALVALMSGSPKLRQHLGFDNVVHNIRINSTIYTNVLAIPMLIEALQHAMSQWGRDRDTHAAASAVQNLLIRHGGRREDRIQLLHERANDPLLCMVDGWKAVVALPISFVRAFGLLSEGRAERTRSSFWFKLYSAILFLAAVGATAIAYIADRQEVDRFLQGLF